MSMHPQPIKGIPQFTVEVARAAFPKGNTYMTLRDELGMILRMNSLPICFRREGNRLLLPGS